MADTYTVARATTVKAPAESIYAHIADFRNWSSWSPWEDLDPNMQKTYSGSDLGVGAIYSWSGNRKAGEGRMEITEAVEASRVSIALDFLKPFKSSSVTAFDLTPEDEATRVAWTMTGPQTILLRIMGIFKSMDKMVGPDFEKGLGRLKAVAERPES